MMWNGPYGMIGDWGGWSWLWPFCFVVPLLFLALIVTAVVYLVRPMGWGGHPMGPGMMGDGMERRSSARDVLEERHARGEINREEFLEKKRDIVG